MTEKTICEICGKEVTYEEINYIFHKFHCPQCYSKKEDKMIQEGFKFDNEYFNKYCGISNSDNERLHTHEVFNLLNHLIDKNTKLHEENEQLKKENYELKQKNRGWRRYCESQIRRIEFIEKYWKIWAILLFLIMKNKNG